MDDAPRVQVRDGRRYLPEEESGFSLCEAACFDAIVEVAQFSEFEEDIACGMEGRRGMSMRRRRFVITLRASERSSANIRQAPIAIKARRSALSAYSKKRFHATSRALHFELLHTYNSQCRESTHTFG